MTIESIPIPPERLAPVAKDMASTSKSIAAVLLFLCGLLVIAMIAGIGGDTPTDEDGPKNAAESAGHAVGVVLGVALFAGLPGWLGFRFARNGTRASRAAELAASDPSYTWRLSGKYVVATDPHGAPRPDATFKISGRLRAMVLAVPRAYVHGPD